MYAYAFEFHEALAVLSMLCKAGGEFAWHDSLDLLQRSCKEDQESIINRFLASEITPVVEQALKTVTTLRGHVAPLKVQEESKDLV